jgi:hypothetical protein
MYPHVGDKLPPRKPELHFLKVPGHLRYPFRVTHRDDRIRHMFGLQAEMVDASIRIQNEVGFGKGFHT